MIPPIYILVTVLFSDLATRARYFGVISGAAGLGAAAGPLIGGFVTTVFGWRASFVLQVLVIATIIWLARGLTDPPRDRPAPRFDVVGAVLSAAGLFFVVLGILLTRSYGWLASRQDFTIGGTVVIPKGGVSPIWIFVADRRRHPRLVLPAPAGGRARGPRTAAAHPALQEPDGEPRLGTQTSSGSCCRGRSSRSRCSSRRCAGSARSRPGSC